jgi:ankyrin repeat protein
MYQSSEGTQGIVDFEGRTPLHLAASKGHFNVVKYLVEFQHCDVNKVFFLALLRVFSALSLLKRLIAIIELRSIWFPPITRKSKRI